MTMGILDNPSAVETPDVKPSTVYRGLEHLANVDGDRTSSYSAMATKSPSIARYIPIDWPN
jgi:hypothetical protein